MTYDTTILAESNLVAYYKLAANANDSGTNAYNGTTNGTATFSQTALAAGLGQCVLFDGSTGYISLPTGTNVAEPISVECWIKDNALSADGCFFDNNAGDGFGVSWFHGGGDIAFVQGGGGSYTTANAFVTATTYYVCLTIDTSHHYTLFAGKVGTDSAPSQWGTATFAAPTYSGSTLIGNVQGSNRFFKGYAGSFAIYNKVLSGSTMNTHYTSGTTAPSGAKLRLSDGYGGVFS